MGWRGRSWVVVAIFASFVAPAAAQTQAFVAPSPGTRLYTSSDTWFEIHSVDGNTVRTVNARLAQATWLGGCGAIGAQTLVDRTAVNALWPLAPRKTASVSSRNEQRS